MRLTDARPRGTPTPEQLLHRLEWQVIRRLDGILQGNYRTVSRGAGLDFLDLREYEAGDDVRHIDWNVTARMDTPFVRQYAEDRELTAWLLLDRSSSRGFGPIDRPRSSCCVSSRRRSHGSSRGAATRWGRSCSTTRSRRRCRRARAGTRFSR